MRKIGLMIVALVGLSVGALAQKHSYQLNVGMFDKLSICDNVNVEYRCVPDSAGYVAFEGAEEFADAFIFTNSRGKLKVQVNTDDVNNPNLPVLRIYSHFLSEVENSSVFTTTVKGTVAIPVLTVKQIGNGKIVVEKANCNEVNAVIATGNGTVTVNGKCNIANLKMVGAGVIQAENLTSNTVKCTMVGSGDIYCNPVDKLEAKGLGSTKIYYKGRPEVKKLGGGKILPLAEK